MGVVLLFAGLILQVCALFFAMAIGIAGAKEARSEAQIAILLMLMIQSGACALLITAGARFGG